MNLFPFGLLFQNTMMQKERIVTIQDQTLSEIDEVAQRDAAVSGALASEQAIEAKIQTMGLTAPRLTPDDLTANIVHTEIVKFVSVSGQVLRWAVLTTRNGFAVTGRPSVSVCAENDRPEVGEQVAIQNARNELWPLMGYELRSKLASA